MNSMLQFDKPPHCTSFVIVTNISAFADWMAAYPIDIDYQDSRQVGRALNEFFHQLHAWRTRVGLTASDADQ
jgi:hypothetical protein